MLLYLVHTTLVWAIFALLYHLLLRNETFFRANRIYLLTASVAGLVLPAITAMPGSSSISPHTYWLPEITFGLHAAQQGLKPLTILSTMLEFIWVSGSSMMLLRFSNGLFSIFRIKQKSLIINEINSKNTLYTQDTKTPFSFFGWIFIPADFAKTDVDVVVAHEQVHARQWHSIDIIWCEILHIIFWWNPLVGWYKNTLSNVHEYLADAYTARQFSRKQYGLLLIRHAQFDNAPAIGNSFFQSSLKQRIVMLTKKASAPSSALRYTLVGPIAALLFIFLQQNIAFSQQTANPVPPKADNTTEKTVDKAPEYPGGDAALMQFLSKNIKYPEAAKQAKASEMIVVSFVVNTEGAVQDAVAKKGIRQDLIDEAIRVISLTRWIPGVDKGDRVNCQLALPIRFKLD